VRTARKAAAHALKALRAEIASLRSRLEELVTEEKSFVSNLFPSTGARARRRGRPGRRVGRVERGPVRRRGPARADRFFAELPERFTLDAVRKVAGRLAGFSIAQWARAKKIAKTASGYVKTGAGSPKKAVGKVRKGAKTRAKRRVASKPPQQKRTEAAVATGKS
jgi:hypothetical protein